MARQYDATSETITVSSSSEIDNIFAAGGSFFAWVNLDSDGAFDSGRIYHKGNFSPVLGTALSSVGESGGAVKLSFFVDFSGVDGVWQTTSTDVTLNQWVAIGLSYDSDSTSNDPIIYVGGASKAITETATPTGSKANDSGTPLGIGNRSSTSTPTIAMDGDVAETSFWDVVLTADEFAALANGVSPNRIRRQNLVSYYPLYGIASPEPDLSGSANHGTVTGATQADHAPVGRYAPRPRFGSTLEQAVIPPTEGVDIQGTHAVADLRGIGEPKKRQRTLTFGILITGQVANISRVQLHGQVQTEARHTLTSKVMADSQVALASRLMIPHTFEALGEFYSHTEATLPNYPNQLRENLTFFKLKKIINTYRRLVDEEE